MNYHDHNDSKGRDARIRVAINRDERARQYAVANERDFGSITLFMSKRDVWRARIGGAIAANCPLSIMAPR